MTENLLYEQSQRAIFLDTFNRLITNKKNGQQECSTAILTN